MVHETWKCDSLLNQTHWWGGGWPLHKGSSTTLKVRKAKIIGTDISRLLDNIMEEHESSLLIASIFSVKWEAN